jgi:hypothetical protein
MHRNAVWSGLRLFENRRAKEHVRPMTYEAATVGSNALIEELHNLWWGWG